MTKKDNVVEMGVLENCIREDLDPKAPRAMCVLRPLKVVITNYPEGAGEWLEAANHPKDPAMGVRKVPFSRTLYIERDDFMESPPVNFHRLAPGREVRLRYAYLVTCTDVIRDPATGAVCEIRCSYDPASRGGTAPDGRKVKGTIDWVCAERGVRVETRLYDRLFNVSHPASQFDDDFRAHLNPDSIQVLEDSVAEPALAAASPGDRFQFERQGYFCVDGVDSGPGRPVFNRTVTLRDTWAKLERRGRTR